MQKVCTRCNAHLVHSNRAENQVAILLYEFRETVPVNVALGQFFLKVQGHQHRTHGQMLIKITK